MNIKTLEAGPKGGRQSSLFRLEDPAYSEEGDPVAIRRGNQRDHQATRPESDSENGGIPEARRVWRRGSAGIDDSFKDN